MVGRRTNSIGKHTMKPKTLRGLVIAVCIAITASVVGGVGTGWAGPLNPADFPLSGVFPTVAGTYTFDTGGTPTLTGPGGTSLTGVVFNGVAVFDFNAITVGSDQTFVGTGSLPLALLSQGDITVNGTIDVSGGPGGGGGPGGPPFFGGGGGGGGPGGGGGGRGGDYLAGGPLPGGPGGGAGGGGGGSAGALYGVARRRRLRRSRRPRLLHRWGHPRSSRCQLRQSGGLAPGG